MGPAIAWLGLVPLVTLAVVWATGPSRSGPDLRTIAAFALGCGAVIGLPVLHWAVEHGRTRAWHLMLLGGFAGVLPPVLLIASGALGLAAKGGMDYVRWVFAHGPSIPWYGLLRWSEFYVLVGKCVFVGATSGAVVTLFLRDKRLSTS
jgi:hypothetical protein